MHEDGGVIQSQAALFITIILPIISGCTPISRPAPAGPVSPIAIVGDSDDHRGFALRGNLARVYLANGVQIIAPPQKDLVELYGDINSCRYGGGSEDVHAYLACLHNAGDNLQFPNGKTLAWGEEGIPGRPKTYEQSPQPQPFVMRPAPSATNSAGPLPASATSPILLDCVLMPNRDQEFRLSLDMDRRTAIDGDEPPTTFTTDGQFITWHSQVFASGVSTFNTRTLEVTTVLGGFTGRYACKRI